MRNAIRRFEVLPAMNEGESRGVELQFVWSDVSKVHVVGEFERVKVDHRVLPEAMILVFFEISSPGGLFPISPIEPTTSLNNSD